MYVNVNVMTGLKLQLLTVNLQVGDRSNSEIMVMLKLAKHANYFMVVNLKMRA